MNPIIMNMKRASSEMMLLALLTTGEKYGYQLAQEIKKRSEGKFTILEGSMYTILNRLKENGDVTFRSELVGEKMTRVYYKITPTGEEHLKEMSTTFDEYYKLIHKIMEQ